MLEDLPFLLLEFSLLFGVQLLLGKCFPVPFKKRLTRRCVPGTDKTGLRLLLARAVVFQHYFAVVL